jgi:hypothetical protein
MWPQTTTIGGFVGLKTINGQADTGVSGPDGLVVLTDRNELYVGDAIIRRGTLAKDEAGQLPTG